MQKLGNSLRGITVVALWEHIQAEGLEDFVNWPEDVPRPQPE